MIVAVDSSVLTLLVNPSASPPKDPATGLPLTQAKERIERLVDAIERDRGTILVPTPALAEVLVRTGDAAPEVLERLNRSARFKLADFDQRAAIEVAAMTREALRVGGKKSESGETWQKVKYDRQIIAVARVNMASKIYSDDAGIATFGEQIGLDVIKTWELPAPEVEATLFTAFGIDSPS